MATDARAQRRGAERHGRSVPLLRPHGAAEFLYACVRRTVEDDLPREIDYLRRHDEAIHRIVEAVEMPDRIAENLAMFIRQNNGALSRNRREGESSQLCDEEVRLAERIVGDAFAGFGEAPGQLGTIGSDERN